LKKSLRVIKAFNENIPYRAFKSEYRVWSVNGRLYPIPILTAKMGILSSALAERPAEVC
jgi:hypothetical protein